MLAKPPPPGRQSGGHWLPDQARPHSGRPCLKIKKRKDTYLVRESSAGLCGYFPRIEGAQFRLQGGLPTGPACPGAQGGGEAG